MRDVGDVLLAGQHMADVVRRSEAEENVDVTKAEVGVDDADAVAEAGAEHAARLMTTFVLPTPPLPLVTARIVPRVSA